MRMDDIGYNHKHDSNFIIDRPDGAGDCLLLAIKTKSIFRENGELKHCLPNTIIIYTPEHPQYYGADGEEYANDWIHFGFSEQEEELISKLEIPLNEPFPVSDITQISNIIRNMCCEHYSANKNRRESVDLYFRLLLFKINECAEGRTFSGAVTENKYFESLLWLRESIYRWPAKDWNIDNMATEISLSRSRLQHLYTETFGVSISKDIISSRIEKAKDLLKNPELSVNDISTIVGYNNPSYFNRQFKTVYGKTPTQFRAEFLETDFKK